MTILTPILGVLGVGGIGAALFFIPGAMGAVAKLASAAVTFIVGLPWAKIWWIVPVGLALLYAGIERGEARHWQKLDERDAAGWAAEKAASAQTVANYRAAAETARKADADNKARVEAAQGQTTKEVSNDYEARLAALRAAYDKRLQQHATPKADPGGSGTAPVPVPGPAPGGPDAATAPRDEIDFNCRANSLQLEELQRWVREQAAIPVEPPAPAH